MENQNLNTEKSYETKPNRSQLCQNVSQELDLQVIGSKGPRKQKNYEIIKNGKTLALLSGTRELASFLLGYTISKLGKET